MSEAAETLTLAPAQHGKLGAVHCGVTREGFIAVGGDPHEIGDGKEVLFTRNAVKAKREGSVYTFSRVAK